MMRFTETSLSGAYVVAPEAHADARGTFARMFCAREFADHGLENQVVQCSTSVTRRAGAVRGLHVQVPPALEAKIVRCVRGVIHDVIVDVRAESPTYMESFAVELSAENKVALCVPAMCAHGFQALTDDVEVFYMMSNYHAPEAQRGLRFDDPAIALVWPLPVTDVSERDRSWPLVGAEGLGFGRAVKSE